MSDIEELELKIKQLKELEAKKSNLKEILNRRDLKGQYKICSGWTSITICSSDEFITFIGKELESCELQILRLRRDIGLL